MNDQTKKIRKLEARIEELEADLAQEKFEFEELWEEHYGSPVFEKEL